MKYGRLFFVTISALLITTGCDCTRSKMGMSTSEDIAAKRLAQERAAMEAHVRDSLEKVYRDSLDRIESGSVNVIDANGSINSGDNFHLVVGSFLNYDNATKLVNYLKQNGYPNAFYFDLPNTFRSVSAASYPTTQEAYIGMYQILNKYLTGVDDVWIYKK